MMVVLSTTSLLPIWSLSLPEPTSIFPVQLFLCLGHSLQASVFGDSFILLPHFLCCVLPPLPILRAFICLASPVFCLDPQLVHLNQVGCLQSTGYWIGKTSRCEILFQGPLFAESETFPYFSKLSVWVHGAQRALWRW